MDPQPPATIPDIIAGDSPILTADDIEGVPDAFMEPLVDGEDPAMAVDTEEA
jgi:hypothetical protein